MKRTLVQADDVAEVVVDMGFLPEARTVLSGPLWTVGSADDVGQRQLSPEY